MTMCDNKAVYTIITNDDEVVIVCEEHQMRAVNMGAMVIDRMPGDEKCMFEDAE